MAPELRALFAHLDRAHGAGEGVAVPLGLYPIVTLQYSSTNSYQVPYHIQ